MCAFVVPHDLHWKMAFKDEAKSIERALAFRDFLIAHPKIAKEYSDLKKSLTNGNTVTWETYMDGKDPFVSRVELQAVGWYQKLKR